MNGKVYVYRYADHELLRIEASSGKVIKIVPHDLNLCKEELK